VVSAAVVLPLVGIVGPGPRRPWLLVPELEFDARVSVQRDHDLSHFVVDPVVVQLHEGPDWERTCGAAAVADLRFGCSPAEHRRVADVKTMRAAMNSASAVVEEAPAETAEKNSQAAVALLPRVWYLHFLHVGREACFENFDVRLVLEAARAVAVAVGEDTKHEEEVEEEVVVAAPGAAVERLLLVSWHDWPANTRKLDAVTIRTWAPPRAVELPPDAQGAWDSW
jgi:hypothetical protein